LALPVPRGAPNRAGNLTRLASVGLALSHDSAQRSGTAPFLIATSRARISFTAPPASHLGTVTNWPSRLLRPVITAPGWAGTVTADSSSHSHFLNFSPWLFGIGSASRDRNPIDTAERRPCLISDHA